MPIPDSRPRLLRLRDVMHQTGLGRTAIYDSIRRGDFPPPRKLTRHASAWLESEIHEWIESRPVAKGLSGAAA